MAAFQAADAGPIPATRSKEKTSIRKVGIFLFGIKGIKTAPVFYKKDRCTNGYAVKARQ